MVVLGKSFNPCLPSHLYSYPALINTTWSISEHCKCKYSDSSLLSLLIAVCPAFMLPQVEATWLKAEDPSLSTTCSVLKA